MKSMLGCYGTLSTYITQSLEDSGGSTAGPPAPLPPVPAMSSLQTTC
jgi:hypothetical protein